MSEAPTVSDRPATALVTGTSSGIGFATGAPGEVRVPSAEAAP